jgi:hypothetical protein
MKVGRPRKYPIEHSLPNQHETGVYPNDHQNRDRRAVRFAPWGNRS